MIHQLPLVGFKREDWLAVCRLELNDPPASASGILEGMGSCQNPPAPTKGEWVANSVDEQEKFRYKESDVPRWDYGWKPGC